MPQIQRQATGMESLAIAPCPCCGGEIEVMDCGYSSFNPGTAKCLGACSRKWSFSSVGNQWDCGLKWNERAKVIRRKLLLLSMLKVDRKLSISRDFSREELEEDAELLRRDFEVLIIGAD